MLLRMTLLNLILKNELDMNFNPLGSLIVFAMHLQGKVFPVVTILCRKEVTK